MLNKLLTIDLIRTIIVEELEIDPERVNIYNQKFIIPTWDNLFIVIEYKSSPRIISSRNKLDEIDGDIVEVQDLNIQEDIVIGLFSKNLEALQRKEEVVMSLFSIYSQQIQETNSFKIFPNPTMTDLSSIEATAILYRIEIDIRVHAWYEKVKVSEFYNADQVFIRVNDGSPDLTRGAFDIADPT